MEYAVRLILHTVHAYCTVYIVGRELSYDKIQYVGFMSFLLKHPSWTVS